MRGYSPWALVVLVDEDIAPSSSEWFLCNAWWRLYILLMKNVHIIPGFNKSLAYLFFVMPQVSLCRLFCWFQANCGGLLLLNTSLNQWNWSKSHAKTNSGIEPNYLTVIFLIFVLFVIVGIFHLKTAQAIKWQEEKTGKIPCLKPCVPASIAKIMRLTRLNISAYEFELFPAFLAKV